MRAIRYHNENFEKKQQFFGQNQQHKIYEMDMNECQNYSVKQNRRNSKMHIESKINANK